MTSWGGMAIRTTITYQTYLPHGSEAGMKHIIPLPRTTGFQKIM